MKFVEFSKNILLREVILRFILLKRMVTFLWTKKIGLIPALKHTLNTTPGLIKKLYDLQQEGFVFIENVTSEVMLDKIVHDLQGKTCVDLYHPHLGSFSPDCPPVEAHVAHYLRQDVVKIPEALKIANDEKVLALVQGYLGCKPVISNLLIWWSYPEREQAEYAQLYHRDYDDIRFVKLFVYLTDVDENAGPHTYIKKSANSRKLRRPKRHSDQKIEQNFPAQDKMIFCGKRGTTFLEDTFGIHKGQTPYNKKRLILQVEYAMNPLLGEQYEKVPLNEVGAISLDPYINQLLIQFNQHNV